ncbi:site-specific integrase [Pedobacter frigiditerrae]|uniref:tyrosine-type recombinase/integrase n=1 Tax=Pedobacter frigiditerrae TaxID=2530452 RepID=UPI00292E2B34|nr:site-specific integrase [Pedobacter frigiditerrae]
MSYNKLKIYRGKKPNPSLKGNKRKDWIAKQEWYIEYYFSDPNLNIKNQRMRTRHKLNHLKDYDEKEARAQVYFKKLKQLLDDGFNPLNPLDNAKLLNQAINLNIKDAIDLYVTELKELNNRPKTISTYLSKLRYLANYFPHHTIKSLSANELERFLRDMQVTNNWMPQTFNTAKNIIVIFFNFLVRKRYLESNPASEIQNKKANQSSSKHIPMSDEDFEIVKSHLKAHDEFTYMFVLTIYYTCIRPKELRGLRCEMINLKSQQITIPGTVSKNGKSLPVDILDKLQSLLFKYKIEEKPIDYFMFSKSPSLFGKMPVGENTPYNRFIAVLKKLKMDNKGYTLYSIKHLANIHRYEDGWTVQAIMKANRHSTLTETENYLRNIGIKVDVTKLKTR